MDFDVDVTRLDFYIDTLARSARLHVRSRIFCVTDRGQQMYNPRSNGLTGNLIVKPRAFYKLPLNSFFTFTR